MIEPSMSRPTILLGMPADNEIFRLIEKNLLHHGFDVINIIDQEKFRYPSLSARVKTKFRQLILQDKQAKNRLKAELASQKAIEKISSFGRIDYALFIRADIYSVKLLNEIRRYIDKCMINYQWDGMHRYPDIQACIPYFDRFYVFDAKDVSAPFLPNTNFYFDYDLDLPDPTTDFYFVGSHLDGRHTAIANFGKLAQSEGWNIDFHICLGCKNAAQLNHYRSLYPTDNINFLTHYRSFEQNLNAAKRAKVLMDFKTPIHNGLSFRVFEALGYRKKLITTNSEIEKYDFYHPNNILIWDGVDFDLVKAFLKLPYHPLPDSIYEKYSFGNWIRYVLQIEPYLEIRLP